MTAIVFAIICIAAFVLPTAMNIYAYRKERTRGGLDILIFLGIIIALMPILSALDPAFADTIQAPIWFGAPLLIYLATTMIETLLFMLISFIAIEIRDRKNTQR